jgi:hypothetical protein
LQMIWSYTLKILKTPPKKKIQQNSRIQNQHIKISSLSIHKKWTVWERNQGNNTICNIFKKLKHLGIILIFKKGVWQFYLALHLRIR